MTYFRAAVLPLARRCLSVLVLANAPCCLAAISGIPDIVEGIVLRADTNTPIEDAAVDVEICTRKPLLGLPGPEGTPHSTIWEKQHVLSRKDGHFEFDLRPWKARMNVLRRHPDLIVFSIGVKAAGFEDKRVLYGGQPVTVRLAEGVRNEAERTYLCQ